jgi:hypothetical protein
VNSSLVVSAMTAYLLGIDIPAISSGTVNCDGEPMVV